MELINKDALVAGLKNMIDDYWSDSENTMGIYPYNLEEAIEYADTLEVKEVDLGNEFDLNKEIDEQIRLLGGVHKLDNNSKRWYTGPYEELFHFARHFIELGLKAKSMPGNNDSNPTYKKFD